MDSVDRLKDLVGLIIPGLAAIGAFLATIWSRRRHVADASREEAAGAKLVLEAWQVGAAANAANQQMVGAVQTLYGTMLATVTAEFEKRLERLEQERLEEQRERQRLERRVSALVRFNGSLLSGINILVAQIEAAGLTPAWRTPEWHEPDEGEQ